MTKRDFELIADVIAASYSYLSREQRAQLASYFAVDLERQNPRFDTIQFFRRALPDSNNRIWDEFEKIESEENVPPDPDNSAYHN